MAQQDPLTRFCCCNFQIKSTQNPLWMEEGQILCHVHDLDLHITGIESVEDKEMLVGTVRFKWAKWKVNLICNSYGKLTTKTKIQLHSSETNSK